MAVRVEIPGFYVDSLLVDEAAADLVIINRFPEPGAVEVPIDTSITLDIADVSGSSPDPNATQVYVAGALAFDSGAFQSGYNGPGSATSNPDSDTLRVAIDPTSTFSSLEEVEVRVVSSNLTATASIDTTYSFTIQDLTAPIVEKAKARNKNTIRVSFDEAVRMLDETGSADALNPSNYTFKASTVPAVSVEAVDVEKVTASEVDVTTDIELTFGATYTVEVHNVVDSKGNVVAPSANEADFLAFVPPRPEGRTFEHFRFLAQINRDMDLSRDLELFSKSLQDTIDLILCLIDEWTDILDPDIAAEDFVDAMLDDLGNPFPFANELDLIDKRRLLRVLVDIYRLKGTKRGIIDVIRFFLGIEVDVVAFSAEGWTLGEDELGAESILAPSSLFTIYSFEVVSPVVLTEEQRDRITDIVKLMKPAHTHLAEIVEPTVPTTPDHWEIGLSEMGEETILH